MSDRKTALITGASSGIGYELARLFARDQHNLILVARSRDKLVKLASGLEKEFGTKSLIVPVDLSAVGGAEARPLRSLASASALRLRSSAST